jgi:D-lyxose ketol-isomerase
MTRREWLTCVGAGAAAAGLAAAGIGGCAPESTAKREVIVHQNTEFYDKDGKFDEPAAKKACFEMMERFHYPIGDNLRKNLWALDFGLGKFTEAGMGGIFWINDKEGKYLGHEIFLLPGQMIPEHWHVKTDEAVAKAEAWHLRYGAVTLFGEGDPTPGAEKAIPASEREFTTVRHAITVKPGEVYPLVRVETRHFMVAGPPGCIVTEYASYHDMKALRFTNPKAKV